MEREDQIVGFCGMFVKRSKKNGKKMVEEITKLQEGV
jgi:hypothetical protein